MIPTHPLHVRTQGTPTVHFAMRVQEPGFSGVRMPQSCGYFEEDGKYAVVPEHPVTCPRCLAHNSDETISNI